MNFACREDGTAEKPAASLTFGGRWVHGFDVGPRARAGSVTNTIHPTAIISGNVQLGSGNTIGPFVVITGPVTIGDGNWIGAGAVIGAPSEVRGATHPTVFDEPAGNGVVIGDRNTIREAVQVHQGWAGVTTLGDDLFLMNQSYVAHDCTVGDRVTMASSALLAGHVVVNDGANLGLGAVVHQRRRIGAGVMIGMGSVVTRDVPPFTKAFGNPVRIRGVNRVGMERGGVPETAIAFLEQRIDRLDDTLEEILQHPELGPLFKDWASPHGAAE